MQNTTDLGTSNTEMMAISRVEYEKLQSSQARVSELEMQVQWLMEQLKLLKRKQFKTRGRFFCLDPKHPRCYTESIGSVSYAEGCTQEK